MSDDELEDGIWMGNAGYADYAVYDGYVGYAGGGGKAENNGALT